MSRSSDSILPYAITVAQAFGSKLHLLHVMDPDAVNKPERLEDFPPIRDFFAVERDDGFSPPLKKTVAVAKSYLYNDDPAYVIAQVAKGKGMDLVCLAATRVDKHTFPWWSAGNTIEHTLRHAPCSVLCVRGKPVKPKEWQRPHFRHILLLTDLHDQNEESLQRIMPWVQRFNSLLHVFPVHRKKVDEQAALRELCQTKQLKTNVLLFAKPEKRVENLLSFVSETPIELIAMTPRIRSEFSNRLISDVFVRLMRAVDCPILVLR